MIDNCTWLNFRWGLDVQYVNAENAPILDQLLKDNENFFWHDGFCFKKQSVVILRWPDWRNHYRVNMEKVRVKYNHSLKQKKLTWFAPVDSCSFDPKLLVALNGGKPIHDDKQSEPTTC